MYEYEQSLINQGYNFIAGVDEAGRGPLFGPVVAACVVLPKNFKCDLINDSKKLTEKKREICYDIILENALSIGIGIIDSNRIDEINIYEASKEAMLKAINSIDISIDYVLIDAVKLDLDKPSLPIIKGDAKSLTIAASSIIAKVTRDRYMMEVDKNFPQYNFKKHKGYPTKEHINNIIEYGIIDGYRKTFRPIKDLINID